MKQPSCEERVQEAAESRLRDIRAMYAAGYWTDSDEVPDKMKNDLPGLANYGLSIDRVAPGTFSGQPVGYIRYQLSWGGPSEEFRIYDDGQKVEFWFLDWFDGACLEITGKDADMIYDIAYMGE